ncbi:MAG TPA: choice-of-anchor Q domain-containing protein [Solirubrobacteraceae bacterium]|nr:choice-of-anchor Q domain-containing protein [Solirubrobacteraceae bacterium]
MRPARTLALSLALTLLAAAPAAGATYAAPGGSGDCSQASPCSLQTAVTQAASQADKTAIALPGDYILTGTATVPSGVTLQGSPGADIAGPTGMAGVSTAAGTIERIVLEGFGAGGSAVHLTGGGTLVDAVAKGNDGADAVLSDSGGTLTNVTAYAAGGGAALHVATLALAWPGVGSSILASDGSAPAVRNDSAQSPSYDHTDAGTVDPQFVSPPGDLRLKAGSPAVDAGVPGVDPTGRLDADGLPRQFGAAIDQGAYELTPPGVSAAPVDAVGQSTATFHGTVFPNARETQLSFLYGPASAPFSSSRPVGTLPAGTAPVAVSQAITGLQPGTTYLVSLVASSSAGVQASPPITFATAPAPPAPIVLPPRRAATILLLGSNRVRVDSRRRWRVLIQCPKIELYSCQGVLAVRSVKAVRFGPGPKKRLVFGSLRFDVPAGATMRIGPTLTKARAKLARKLRSTPVAVSVITQGAALDDQRFFARRFTMLGPRR